MWGLVVELCVARRQNTHIILFCSGGQEGGQGAGGLQSFFFFLYLGFLVFFSLRFVCFVGSSFGCCCGFFFAQCSCLLQPVVVRAVVNQAQSKHRANPLLKTPPPPPSFYDPPTSRCCTPTLTCRSWSSSGSPSCSKRRSRRSGLRRSTKSSLGS